MRRNAVFHGLLLLFAHEKSLVLALPTTLSTLQWEAPLKGRQASLSISAP